jgi:DNA polymerase-3 subunit epsilon
MKTILFYDTETTGLPNWKIPSESPEQPHIVQLAAILVDANTKVIMQSMSVIIKPDGWTIPQETIDIHGITNELAAEVGISEKLALETLEAMRGNSLRVAYNKTFDQRIVRIGMKRYLSDEQIEKWHQKDDHECAMRMAQKLIGGKNPKLVEAYKDLVGKEMIGAHNAMSDTLGCMEVYFAIKETEQ